MILIVLDLNVMLQLLPLEPIRMDVHPDTGDGGRCF